MINVTRNEVFAAIAGSVVFGLTILAFSDYRKNKAAAGVVLRQRYLPRTAAGLGALGLAGATLAGAGGTATPPAPVPVVRPPTGTPPVVPPGTPPGPPPGPVVTPTRVFMGESKTGSSDPTPDENGNPFGVHRTFFTVEPWTRLTAQVTTDHAARRIPWVSIRPEGTYVGWAARRPGYVASVTRLMNLLKAIPGPVLLTPFHEPQDDAGANARDFGLMIAETIAVRNRTGAANVKVVPTLMNRWLPGAGTFLKDHPEWLATAKGADIFGIDYYAPGINGRLTGPNYAPMVNAMRKVVPVWAVGEFGQSKAPGFDVWKREVNAFALQAERDGAYALSYFNSTLNSREDWTLVNNYLIEYNRIRAKTPHYR